MSDYRKRQEYSVKNIVGPLADERQIRWGFSYDESGVFFGAFYPFFFVICKKWPKFAQVIRLLINEDEKRGCSKLNVKFTQAFLFTFSFILNSLFYGSVD